MQFKCIPINVNYCDQLLLPHAAVLTSIILPISCMALINMISTVSFLIAKIHLNYGNCCMVVYLSSLVTPYTVIHTDLNTKIRRSRSIDYTTVPYRALWSSGLFRSRADIMESPTSRSQGSQLRCGIQDIVKTTPSCSLRSILLLAEVIF